MKKNKIKVGFLTHAMAYGGATISLYLLEKSIHKNENIEKFLFIGTFPVKDILDLYIPLNHKNVQCKLNHLQNNQVTRVNLLRFIWYKNSNPQNVIDFINKNDLDIIHINTTVFSYLLKPIKIRTKAKIIIHARELVSDDFLGIKKRYIISNTTKYADLVIAISDNEASNYPLYKKLVILPNPFDFSKVQKYSGTRHHNRQIRVGMLSNLSRAKGNLEFLKALDLIINNKNTLVDFKFVIVGANLNYYQSRLKRIIKKIIFRKNYTEKLLKFISDRQLENYIEIIPFNLDVFKYLNEIDIVVRPAITADPWGRDIIEAMAMKKPVIATGTSQFYIEDGVTGFLVPPQNPNLLADRIVELINDQTKRELFGQNGYNKIIQLCDIENYGKTISDIYYDLLGTGNSIK